MADNYLENQMEKYMAGKLKSQRTKTVTRQRRPGELVVKYPIMTVFVSDGTSALGREVVKVFREIDAKVAFTADDRKKATAFAQEIGARFIPKSDDEALKDVVELWGNIDVIVTDSSLAGGPVPGAILFDSRFAEGRTEAQAARLMRFLSHPDNRDVK